MADRVILAWDELFDLVSEYFKVSEFSEPHFFGWREKSKSHPGPRVIWVPGNDKSNAVGEVTAPSRPGRNPAPVANVIELFTLYCVSNDFKASEDERAQYRVARLLMDRLLVAITKCAGGLGNFVVVSNDWETNQKERRWGAAIRLVLARGSAVLDERKPTAPVDTAAEITFFSPTHSATPTESEPETILREVPES